MVVDTQSVTTPTLFQFQDGSIKWTMLYDCVYCLPTFQFQDGSIKWAVATIAANAAITFQFQDGSIKWSRYPFLWLSPYHVSIPRWFD